MSRVVSTCQLTVKLLLVNEQPTESVEPSYLESAVIEVAPQWQGVVEFGQRITPLTHLCSVLALRDTELRFGEAVTASLCCCNPYRQIRL